MRNFLLFSGKSHYASGGALDYIASFETIEECISVWNYIKFWDYIEDDENELLYDYEWAHVLDIESREIIMVHEGSHCGQRN